MTQYDINTGLQLRSIIKNNGILELSLATVEIPEPKPEEVIVRIEASPINPSDLVLLFGPADMKTAKHSGTETNPVVTASVPPNLMKTVSTRIDQSIPVGNEGAGVVIKTGSSDTAQALLGKVVAFIGGAMYSQYCSIQAVQCLVLPEGTVPAEGAFCAVNLLGFPDDRCG